MPLHLCHSNLPGAIPFALPHTPVCATATDAELMLRADATKTAYYANHHCKGIIAAWLGAQS